MMPTALYPNWKDRIVYGEAGPEPQILLEDEKIKLILGGLKPGQQIPDHPEGQAIYYFLEGEGVLTADGEAMPVKAGSIVTMPAETVRGVKAETQLAFMALRVA